MQDAMSDENIKTAAVVQQDDVRGNSRRRGCVGHLKRFWLSYALVLVVIIVVVIPVM